MRRRVGIRAIVHVDNPAEPFRTRIGSGGETAKIVCYIDRDAQEHKIKRQGARDGTALAEKIAWFVGRSSEM